MNTFFNPFNFLLPRIIKSKSSLSAYLDKTTAGIMNLAIIFRNLGNY
ncbi:hypothetical protein [Acidianus sp.]